MAAGSFGNRNVAVAGFVAKSAVSFGEITVTNFGSECGKPAFRIGRFAVSPRSQQLALKLGPVQKHPVKGGYEIE